MQKIYQSMGGAPGGMPNFHPGQGGAPGSGPEPGSKGTATGSAEDVE